MNANHANVQVRRFKNVDIWKKLMRYHDFRMSSSKSILFEWALEYHFSSSLISPVREVFFLKFLCNLERIVFKCYFVLREYRLRVRIWSNSGLKGTFNIQNYYFFYFFLITPWRYQPLTHHLPGGNFFPLTFTAVSKAWMER